MEAYDLSLITLADFTPHLEEPLDIHFEKNLVTRAVLRNVTELNNYSPLERKAFSIELQTTGDLLHRSQGIYRIIHPNGKFLDAFMVPLGPGVNGMRYEVVFS